MEKKLILNALQIEITLSRLSHQLIENHQDFSDTILLGLQPRGIFLLDALVEKLTTILSKKIVFGYLDTTFHRDDFRKREVALRPNSTKIEHSLENKKIILIDDVLYTGRSVRAALDAMLSFGRPSQVEMLTLINRLYTRDLPIEPNYSGIEVNTLEHQKVIVEWKNKDIAENQVWLVWH
ncbi:MAG: bifunctional pyr operon transcriptional regulator/uracil phosphoribosyltransferase PyrR [Cytophagia bacterium]|nr:MAG: bifunctional pyr operon transcriptional regulator/uracil phosphoribosyltransferase PyrR [Cytophagales bacterium]TAG00315.1 MAG: bifunctional pyr operon transcriptional regulator/uracil phosphoribosyltransferase PyrR [Cytophagia bacterium]TAG46495.1 MAG: bifunctional pyr operon transcriptional regulator/uracil phosphoribosyltransferase PyrR [Cytophagia bacterium]TAH29107.1 MAG: bifunctional pyr operon transcriptional regulator/uracil phosphoribosyltransferase PyrR [Cytophagales bacterium]